MVRIGYMLLFFSLNVHAGFNGLTSHSRANCANNESISWDWQTNHMLGTISQHNRGGQYIHRVISDWQNTWRSAAVHWGEAVPGSGWNVVGYHWIMIGGQQMHFDMTNVNDCSIYDGWWEKEKEVVK